MLRRQAGNGRGLLDEVELLLVIGSTNSSNSKRLVEVARTAGIAAYLIDDVGDIDPAWLDAVETVGITSGASAPERLVSDVCDWFRERGVSDVTEHRSVYEDVVFRLPVELRRGAGRGIVARARVLIVSTTCRSSTRRSLRGSPPPRCKTASAATPTRQLTSGLPHVVDVPEATARRRTHGYAPFAGYWR